MFDIEYKGGNGVVISTKKTTLAVDPKLSVIGLRNTATKDVVELATEARFAVNDKDAALNIEGPGEYEIGDFSIRGIPATRHLDAETDEKLTTIYRIEVGDVRIALVGNISPITLSEEQLESIGLVDVLIVPIGGNGYTLDATSAVSLLRQIDPKVVIPVHYADDALKYEVAQDPLETFVKELGAPVETVAKYKVKSNATLPVSLTVIEVTRS
jgi:L-ascorbate metabolism protein UlaG (beta-lactamase superfamily)